MIATAVFGVQKKKIAIQNRVAVRGTRLLDPDDVDPTIEESLIESIREYVEPGESVVVVGGGRGVSTVWMARQVGPDGSVITYEPGDKSFDGVTQTVEMNGASHIADVRRAAVGPTVLVRGSPDGSGRLEPDELPECDVLELDCEGAELEILENLEIRPRIIIVETHGFLDSSASDTVDALEQLGYEIVDKKTEIEDEGVHILTAKRADRVG